MLMLSNVLAVALVLADEPRPAPGIILTGQVRGGSWNRAGRATGDDHPQEAWRLTLPEAIRIGLENCEVARVVRPAGPDSARGGLIRRADGGRRAGGSRPR